MNWKGMKEPRKWTLKNICISKLRQLVGKNTLTESLQQNWNLAVSKMQL